METVTQNLLVMRRELTGLLGRLREASAVRRRNEPSSSIVIVGATYWWCDLDLEAKRVQSKLLDDYGYFAELIKALLAGRPAEIRAELEAGDREIREIIGQTTPTYYTPEEAFSVAQRRLDELVEAVGDLYDPSEGTSLVVPDTNALIYNPDLEEWHLPGLSSFTVVLVPEVLRELDSLKSDHKNPDVREKSESVIRRIGEYARRGRLDQGVPLRKGVSQICSLALEPRIKQALSWLDPKNSDDRILASLIEIMRTHPRSAVVLVTRDVNLRNKATFARLPVEFPPERKENARLKGK